MGLPGASVSGPPVRVLSVLHAGVLLGPRALLLGRGHRADPACPPAAWGMGAERLPLSPALEEEDHLSKAVLITIVFCAATARGPVLSSKQTGFHSILVTTVYGNGSLD